MTDFVAFGTTDSFSLPAIPGGDQGVMRFAALAQDETVLVKPDIGATGTIDTWTLGFDMLIPAGQGNWASFLQTDPTNQDSDGELFLRRTNATEGGIGISGNYQGSFEYGTWQRVVFTAETAGGSTTLKKYIDGTLVGTQTLTGDRWKLDADDGFLVVSDNDGDVSQGFLSSLLFVPGALGEAEIAALGTADADGFYAASPATGASQFDFSTASYDATFGPALLSAPGDTAPPPVPAVAVVNRLLDAMDTPGSTITYDIGEVFNRDDVTFTVESDDDAVVTSATIDGETLSITLGALGHADLKLTATDAEGNTASDFIRVRAAGEHAYTIVALPDTQDYTDSSLTNGAPQTFTNMTAWLVEQKDAKNINFVVHVGDITQNNLDYEWVVAETALRRLDGEIPYSLLPGNHDQAVGGTAADHSSVFLDALFSPQKQAATNATFGGVYDQEPDRAVNNYHTFTATDGTDWLVLSMEFGPRDDVIRWGADVIEQHLDHQVIVVSHSLTNFASRHDPAGGPLYDEGAGYDYGMGRDPEGANDGETVWREILAKYPNVAFTFSGHIFGDGAETNVSYSQHGNQIVESLVNYQNGISREITGNGNEALGSRGGNGAMRLVTIDPDNDRVTTETYFTEFDDYLDGFRVKPETDRDGLTGRYLGHEETFENWDLSTPEARAIANAGDDLFVAAEAGESDAEVTLDASASIDPDGTATYEWLGADGDVIATGETTTAGLGVGRHALTLQVTDGEGNRTTDAVLVVVTGDATLLLDTFNDGDFDGWVLPGAETPLQFGTPESFGLPALPGGADIVAEIPALTPNKAITLTPNFGAPSGSLVGDYSIIYDILVPDGQGSWTALLQLDTNNASDGELFIRNNNDGTGGIGISGNYQGSFEYGAWQRVGFVFDDQGNGTTILKKYIEGELVGTQNLSGDRWKFDAGRGALLFTDEDGETSDVYANSVLLTDKLFTEAEMAALGGAVAGGVLASAPTPTSAQFDFDGDLDASFGIPTLGFGAIGTGSGNFLVKGTVFARPTAEDGLPAPEGRVFDQSDAEGNLLVWGDEAALGWQDYVLEMTLRSTDNDSIGAVFFWQDADNHYRVELNSETNTRKLISVINGVENEDVGEAGGTRFNTDQTLKIAAKYDETTGMLSTTVFLDGSLLFGDTARADTPITSGTVGLWSDSQRASQFDTVTVTALALDAHGGDDQRLLDRDGNGAETARLRANGTFGPVEIAKYEWVSEDGELVASGSDVFVDLSVGLNRLTLRVTDTEGTVATDRVDVEVVGKSRIWLDDDFSGATIPVGWTIVDEGEFGGVGADGTGSDWTITNGALTQNSNLQSRQLTWNGASNPDYWQRGWSPLGDGVNVLRAGTYALYEGLGSAAWQDYAIEATIRSADNDGLGFLVHYVDAKNYYKLELDSDGTYDRNPGNGAGALFNLVRMKDGVEEILGQVPQRYTVGESFTLRLEIIDQKISAFINGDEIFAYAIEDRSHEAGTVGLYSWASEGVAFDDVTVIGLNAVAEPVAAPAPDFLQGTTSFLTGNQPAPPPAEAPLVAANVVVDTGFQLDGARTTLIEQTGTWNTIKAVVLVAEDYLPSMGTSFLVANFVAAELDLAAALGALDVTVVGAKRGSIQGGDFADDLTWIAHSNSAAYWSDAIAIDAGGGDDTVVVRAVASSTLDNDLLADNAAARNGKLWFRGYDGRDTTATVLGGAGDDSITAFDLVRLIAEGGAGDDTGAGGDGALDTWLLAGLAEGYDITVEDGVVRIEDIDLTDGDTGTDTITGFELVRFADGSQAII